MITGVSLSVDAGLGSSWAFLNGTTFRNVKCNAIPEWHSECNTIPIGKPVRQPLTKAVVQTSINSLNVFKSFQLMLGQPSTLLSNVVKFARINTHVVLEQWFSKWAESPPVWACLRGKGAKKTKGAMGAKQHKCSQSKETACWFRSEVV